MKSENQSLLERHSESVQSFEDAKRDWEESRDFYERALEERFAQMETFEK